MNQGKVSFKYVDNCELIEMIGCVFLLSSK